MTARRAFGDRATSSLVERQMRNWELARSQSYAEDERRSAGVQSFICVSRMVGVGHEAVTRLLGQRLGWPVLDRELLEAMAGDDSLRERIYRTMDQRDLGWWESAVRAVMDGEFVRDDYFHRLCETLLSLARQGSCVFVGRGADLVLPPDQGLRIRLVASREARVSWLAAARQIAELEALAEIERIERQRAAFIQGHFGVAADDPLRHDLVFNLERVTPEQAVELILAARRVLGRDS
jgi:cytidylate kinase